MVQVIQIKDLVNVTTGEIIKEDELSFKVHSSDRLFNKKEYMYKKII